MRRMPRLLLVMIALDRGAALAAADGGLLRHAGPAGPYRVTVFTTPTPLRPGAADVSVLVQDAETGAVLPDVIVHVTGTVAGDREPIIQARATHEAATNKLFQAAVLEVPAAGAWQLVIEVGGPQGSARVIVPVEVEPPLPRWVDLWPWLAWPLVPIACFTLHQVRVWRRQIAAGFGAKPATP